MAVAVTNSTAVLNTAVLLTENPATSSVIDAAEVFTITLTKADYQSVIVIDNVTAAEGTITYSIANGELWANKAALTGSVLNATKAFIEVEGGKVFQDAGTILLTLTPATGKRLLTDHAAAVSVIQTL